MCFEFGSYQQCLNESRLQLILSEIGMYSLIVSTDGSIHLLIIAAKKHTAVWLFLGRGWYYIKGQIKKKKKQKNKFIQSELNVNSKYCSCSNALWEAKLA